MKTKKVIKPKKNKGLLPPEQRSKHPDYKYKTTFCDKVIEIRRAGFSLAHVLDELGIVKDTYYRWRRQHPEFEIACQRADLAHAKHLEDLEYGHAVGSIKGNHKALTNIGRRHHKSWQEETKPQISGNTYNIESMTTNSNTLSIDTNTLSDADLDKRINELKKLLYGTKTD